MDKYILYWLITVPVVLVFIFRASLFELYVSIPLRLSILVSIVRGDCTFSDLVKSERYRKMSRDWALHYFRTFINSPECRDFMERHANEKHAHNAKLWHIGDSTFSLNVATGKVRVICHESGLVFNVKPEDAISDLHDNCPLADPYAMTVHALFYAKHAIAYHDRQHEHFHDLSEA